VTAGNGILLGVDKNQTFSLLKKIPMPFSRPFVRKGVAKARRSGEWGEACGQFHGAKYIRIKLRWQCVNVVHFLVAEIFAIRLSFMNDVQLEEVIND
jgi:hypothetical protein